MCPAHKAVALELEIRKAGIAMSELEYTMMLEAMSRCEGCASQFWCAKPLIPQCAQRARVE